MQLESREEEKKRGAQLHTEASASQVASVSCPLNQAGLIRPSPSPLIIDDITSTSCFKVVPGFPCHSNRCHQLVFTQERVPLFLSIFLSIDCYHHICFSFDSPPTRPPLALFVHLYLCSPTPHPPFPLSPISKRRLRNDHSGFDGAGPCPALSTIWGLEQLRKRS